MVGNAANNIMNLFNNFKQETELDRSCNDLIIIKATENELHRERKQALGFRIRVLRNCLKWCYRDNWINDAAHWDELENWLDHALKLNNYDLEKAIVYYRSIASEPVIVSTTCLSCGYVPPFCCCRFLKNVSNG